MQPDLTAIWAAVQSSLRDPRAMARQLMALNLAPATGLMVLALMAVISALLSSLALLLMPLEGDPMLLDLFSSSLRMAAVQGAVLLVTAMLAQGVGRLFGGSGRLAQAIVLVAWIEFVLLLLQAVQILLLLVAPVLSDVAGLAAVAVFFWLLTNFVAELHGFKSVLTVLFGMFGTFLALSLALAIVLVGFFGAGV